MFLTEDRLVKNVKKRVLINQKKILLIGKGVGVLGSLDDGPSRHQLYEASSCEEHEALGTYIHFSQLFPVLKSFPPLV